MTTALKNKKVKNATVVTINGIKFKSKSEGNTYKVLKERGFKPKYEELKFVLMEGFRPTVPFYNRGKNKEFKREDCKVRDMTYTPDFTFMYKGVLIIIEVKGKENDAFPLKKKLFRKHLETLEGKYMYFEVRNQKELLQTIEIIKGI